jgi:carbamate kinase
MGSKVESAIPFIDSGGDKAIITSIEPANTAFLGKAGTAIHK